MYYYRIHVINISTNKNFDTKYWSLNQDGLHDEYYLIEYQNINAFKILKVAYT